MKNIIRVLGIALIATLMVGCGKAVEVPPTYRGVILTKNGYIPEVITPSKFRLPPCFRYCDALVLLQASDNAFKEDDLSVFMNKDKLKLDVEIRGTYSIPATQNYVERIFDKVTPTKTNDSRVSVIPSESIYNIYAKQALRGIVRSEIVKHSISDVLENREAIGESIHAAIQEKMQTTNTPITISRFELAKIDPPQVIVDAQEAAKKREIDIQKAEADAQVAMVEAERALEVAKAERAVDREKAEAIAEQNIIAAESITPGVLEYKRLEAAMKIYGDLSRAKDGNMVIVVPADASSFANIGETATFAKMVGQEIGRAK